MNFWFAFILEHEDYYDWEWNPLLWRVKVSWFWYDGQHLVVHAGPLIIQLYY